MLYIFFIDMIIKLAFTDYNDFILFICCFSFSYL